MSGLRVDAVTGYLSGNLHIAHGNYHKLITKIRVDYQTALKSNQANGNIEVIQLNQIKCDYARVILEHSHLLITMIYTHAMGYQSVPQDEHWHYFQLFNQHNVALFQTCSTSNKQTSLPTPGYCFNLLDQYMTLIPTLCDPKDTKTYPSNLQPAKYQFLSHATPQQLTQTSQYFSLLTTLTRLYHYMSFSRQLVKLSAQHISGLTPFNNPRDDAAANNNNNSHEDGNNYTNHPTTLLEMILSTSQTNTRILLTKARIVLEAMKTSPPQSNQGTAHNKSKLELLPNQKDLIIPWQDLLNLHNLPELIQTLHIHIQTLIGSIVKSITAPIQILAKIIGLAILFNSGIDEFKLGLNHQDASSSTLHPSTQPLISTIHLLSHYGMWSEFTSSLLLLGQSQQQSSPTVTTNLKPNQSLTQHTLPPIPDPFNVGHNTLFSNQVLHTAHGPLSLAFILQPISLILTQLHSILKFHLPFMACGIEYNTSSNYGSSVLLGHDLGLLLPYFGLEQYKDQIVGLGELRQDLESISFFSATNQSHEAQFATNGEKISSGLKSTVSEQGQLNQIKSIEQLLINNIGLILKFISFSLSSYQQSNPSSDGQLLFDINATRIQWVLQILVKVSSLSTVLSVKKSRSFKLVMNSTPHQHCIVSIDGNQHHDDYDDLHGNMSLNDLPSLEERSESNLSLSSSPSTMSTSFSSYPLSEATNDISVSRCESHITEVSQVEEDVNDHHVKKEMKKNLLSSPPPPPPQSQQLSLKEVGSDGLTVELECAYLLAYLLQLTNATISSSLTAQLATVGLSNPYLQNLMTLLLAGLPKESTLLSRFVEMGNDDHHTNIKMIDMSYALTFIEANYSTTALLPVLLSQIKPILHPNVDMNLFTPSTLLGINSAALSHLDGNDEFYNDKYSNILTLLQQSHSTITKSSTANKSQSQSQVTSTSQHIMVGDFFPSTIQVIIQSAIQTNNTLSRWANLMANNAATAPQNKLGNSDFSTLLDPKTVWANHFISLFSPSLMSSILPQQLTLITTGGSLGDKNPHSQTQAVTSLPLTSISSLTTPSHSLFLFTFDVILTAYNNGLVHNIPSTPQSLPCYLTEGYTLPLSLHDARSNPNPILPTRTTDILHFTISYSLCVSVTLAQLTHQQALTHNRFIDVTDQTALNPLMIANYTPTLLSIISASFAKVVSTYTVSNGLLSYFVLSFLSIPVLTALSILSTSNVYLNTLVNLVLSSSSGRLIQMLNSEGFDKTPEYTIHYQDIKTAKDYPLSYQVPPEVSRIDPSATKLTPTTENTQMISTLILDKNQLSEKIIPIPGNNGEGHKSLSPVASTIDNLTQFVGPKWIHSLVQFFHYQLVPSDLRLCDEQLLSLQEEEEEIVELNTEPSQPLTTPLVSPFSDAKPLQKASPTPQQDSALDMLVKYNIISPYLDSLYGVTSTLAILPSTGNYHNVYAQQTHLSQRKDINLQHRRVAKLQTIIDTLALLSYIARVAPNLALFILKYHDKQNSAIQSALITDANGESVIHDTNPKINRDTLGPFVPTFPLLATLLFLTTSLSMEYDNADIETLAQLQDQQLYQSPLPGEEEIDQINGGADQYITYHQYQLLMTKNITISILAQLTQDIAIKTLLVGHGIDLYSLLLTPDEYMITYGQQHPTLAPQVGFPQATFPTTLIPRSVLSESSTKQVLYSNLILALPQLIPQPSYQPGLVKGQSQPRYDVFGHLWSPSEMLIAPAVKPHPITSAQPIRTIYSAFFSNNAVYSVGVLVASQNIMINKHDSELLLETSTQLLAHGWHQLEYLSYLDCQFLLNIDQWYTRHHNTMVSTSGISRSITMTPWTRSKLLDRKFPHSVFGQTMIGLVINSVAEMFRSLVESLMYLCVDYKVKQAAVKYKLFYLLHAYCGCVSAHNPVPTPSAWKSLGQYFQSIGQQMPDLKPHHVTVQVKNTVPTHLDLFNCIHSPNARAVASSSIVPTTPPVNDMNINTIKLINTYLGEYLLKDTSIRLAVLQILHHFALSKDDIRCDEEQSQTSEQVAALKAAASRGVKTAQRGEKGMDNQKDISELYGTAQEMMPIQLLTTPFILDCLYQVKCAYQYAYVAGLPANIREMIEASLAKSASIHDHTTTTGLLLTLSAKYSNNLLLPIPVMMMISQIVKTYASLKLPNDNMAKRYKAQLAWSYNIPAITLDLNAQSNVLLKEMQRRDLELSGGEKPAETKTIYPQRYYFPRKDHASTTQSDADLAKTATNAAQMLNTEQVTNTVKLISLWSCLSLSRMSIHINPHIIKVDHFHRIFPLLIDCATSEDTTHELTIYECLLAVTNLLVRRDEQEFNYCVENKVIDRCLNQLLLGDASSQFNLDITTAAVELLCNLCGLGVLDQFLNSELTSLDLVKQSSVRQNNHTVINNQGVLLLRVLMQYATYDDTAEKNIYTKTAQGIVESATTAITSLMRLKCAALGCLAMLAGSSPFLAAAIAHTTIATGEGADQKDVAAPVAIMALFQAPVQSPEHEQGFPDPSNGITLGFKDIRLRCRGALKYIQQVIPLIAKGEELNRESW